MNASLPVALRHDEAGCPAAPWRRATQGESRWSAAVAVVAASSLQMILPRKQPDLAPPDEQDEDKTTAQIRDGVLAPGLRARGERFGTAGQAPGPAT